MFHWRTRASCSCLGSQTSHRKKVANPSLPSQSAHGAEPDMKVTQRLDTYTTIVSWAWQMQSPVNTLVATQESTSAQAKDVIGATLTCCSWNVAQKLSSWMSETVPARA